ncbi:MAG TPA: hypothetical protein DEB31_10395 [Clostridiales bacterium]|nr:hypothetical protein [Clostridiales bacterium]
MPQTENWLKLDTAAKIYPSISHTHNNTTFRLDLELYEDVEKDALQQALVKIMPRFPSFGVALKRGLFWYYLEPNNALPIVKEDNRFPCRRLKDFINNGFLFNIMYYKKNVIMECFHGLADGAGAIEFLKTLIYEYLTLLGYDIDAEGMVLSAEGKVRADELENSFNTYYDPKGDYLKLKQPLAYHIVGTALADNVIFATHGEMNLSEFLAVVKKKGVTVSAYVAALLIYAIYKDQGMEDKIVKHPIIISVPIDLRSIFPSNTLRNFVSFANVGVIPGKNTTFDEILCEVSAQLKEGMTEGEIRAKINKNVKFEKNPFIRTTPLFMKNIVVSNSYRLYGEGSYTMVLSNLKTAKFPAAMEAHIKNVYYMLGVSDMNPLNCVVVSYRDKMVITFARGIEQTGVIRQFFEHFSKESGVRVALRGNEQGGQA